MRVVFVRRAASLGCSRLCSELKERGIRTLRTKVSGSNYKGTTGDFVFNWGCGSQWSLSERIVRLFNAFNSVGNSSNKIRAFEKMETAGLRDHLPFWTTSLATARNWITQERVNVYVRNILSGSGGNGIEVVSSVDDLSDAPLYTKGVDIKRELRVHVFNGEVIDFAQKRRLSSEHRPEGLEPNDLIRNHANGWVFAREGVTIGEDIKEVSKRAVTAVELDFGAVDIIISREGRIIILEVNSAPGLEGQTVSNYADAIVKAVM